jgi:hypothetical protein
VDAKAASAWPRKNSLEETEKGHKLMIATDDEEALNEMVLPEPQPQPIQISLCPAAYTTLRDVSVYPPLLFHKG